MEQRYTFTDGEGYIILSSTAPFSDVQGELISYESDFDFAHQHCYFVENARAVLDAEKLALCLAEEADEAAHPIQQSIAGMEETIEMLTQCILEMAQELYD